MGILQNSNAIPSAAGATPFYDFNIEKSCRFDYGSYTSFTPSSSGDLKHFTWSVWVKFSRLDLSSTYGYINTVYGTSGGSYNYNMGIVDQTTNGAELSYQHKWALNTQKSLRDVASWYHIVTSYNLDDGTNSNRVKIYVNGVEYTSSFASDQRSLMNENSNFNNSSYPMHLGRYKNSNGYMDGYIAEVHFLDGYSYDASYFGETKSGIWVAKDYKTNTGNYGSNGFYLEFKQTGTSANSSGIGADTSGNNNHHSLTSITADHISIDTPTSV
tara:strand:- start:364 stop:1176 length:813 start_codon:yes stop_codon:yes gene_type:complete